MDQAVVGSTGERVIPASRRPDGTWRRERLVRDGYVPQDEQPVYQPRAAVVSQRGAKVPGWSEEDGAQPQANSSRTKAAKKNEKRKAKRQEEKKSDDVAACAASDLQHLRLEDQAGASSSLLAAPPGVATSGAPSATVPAPVAAGGLTAAQVIQKNILKIRKKLRECEVLGQRLEQGGQLTAEECAKLDKKPGWEEEVRQLEAQLPGS